MSVRLVTYEAARVALKQAVEIDDVKDIRDKAQAMAAYALQIKNDDMYQWVKDIKLRAERRMGELLEEVGPNKGAATPRTVEIDNAVTDSDRVKPTLAEIGISKKQSTDFKAIASIPEKEFEEAVSTGKETTASLVRKSPKKAKALKEAKEKKPKLPKKPSAAKPAGDLEKRLAKLQADYDELKENRDELADELKTCDSIRTGKAAKEMAALKEHLKIVTRRRDELMASMAECRKQCKWWEGQAKKLGWKPAKK